MTKRITGTAYGGATLIMLFSVLCMTVFAVLTCSSAVFQLRLSERYAASVREYYAADSEAVSILGSLRDARYGTGSHEQPDKYDLTDIAVTQGSDGSISYSVPLNDRLALNVELLDTGKDLEITKWAVADTGNWEPDTSIELWVF